jgi:hypothetical protein
MKLMKIVPILLAFAFGSAFAAEGDGSLPPNPKPGQCFIHKFYPPTWEKGEVSVMIKDGFKKLEIIPAVWKDDTINVTVRDAVDQFSTTGAQFSTTSEKIEIQPEENYWKVDCCPQKPASYKGSDMDWKKSCEVACFKSHPPVYKTITKIKLVKDATSQQSILPPEQRAIPIRRLVTPPSIKVIDIPPEYMKFTTKKLTSPGYMKWEEGTCGKYTCDPRELTGALKVKGYYAGPMDQITPAVIQAMNKFREENGLGIHDELDEQTAKALGITGYVKN